MLLTKLLSQSEGKTPEFKRDFSSLKPTLKTLVAFANTAGGTLDFRSGVSKIRNRVIARVFRELGLMKEWSSGYRRVMESCQNGGYPAPDRQEPGSAFRVIFYPHPEIKVAPEPTVPVNVPVNERQQWFLNRLGAGNKVKAAECFRC